MIPLALKVSFTAFVAVLVPVYWLHYGLANFLWFSDIALFMTVPALWLESPLLSSMPALAVVALDSVWTVDFACRLVARRELIGLTRYMFEPVNPLWIRGLSLFHLFLPALLLWLLSTLGYDPRALPAQTVVAWAAIVASYFASRPEKNVNWVFGPLGRPQKLLPRRLYLALVMLFFPACVYLPSHALFQAVFKASR